MTILKVLIVGDVVGRPGRTACQSIIPKLIQEESLDFVVVNGENMAGGSGVTEKTAQELFEAGVDVITSGDHILKGKNTDLFFHTEHRILRPLNLAKDFPGKGSGVFKTRRGDSVGVISLIGKVFLKDDAENPFVTAQAEVGRLAKEARVVLIDFHAEATSEKVALGWHLDGKVSGIFGTHTHIQTADEKILPQGTAYITDLGMTGPCRSVLGREIEPVLNKFITGQSSRFEVAKDDVRLMGVIVEIDGQSGRSLSIRRINSQA